MQAKREGIRTDAQINQEEIAKGTQQVKAEQPAQLPPAQGAPPAPGEPPPRNEPVVTEALGGPDLQGKGTAEIAETPPPETPAAPEAPAPVRNFRDAVKEADLPVPSPGKRRVQWNQAYGPLTTGRKDPGDVLRELDSDIDHFKSRRAAFERTGDKDPSLDGDIDALDKLGDLIAQEYGLERRKPAPAPAKAVKKAVPTPGAPSTSREAPVRAPEPEKPTVSAARVKKGDVLLVRKNDQGEWDLTRTKTGATPITVTGKKTGNGQHVITGTDPDGNEISTRPIAGQNVLVRHKEKVPATKAAPSVPEAPPEPTNEDLVKRLFNDKKPTMAQLRQFAEDRRVGEGQDIKKMSRRDLVDTIVGEASPRRGRGSISTAPVKKAAPAPVKRPSPEDPTDAKHVCLPCTTTGSVVKVARNTTTSRPSSGVTLAQLMLAGKFRTRPSTGIAKHPVSSTPRRAKGRELAKRLASSRSWPRNSLTLSRLLVPTGSQCTVSDKSCCTQCPRGRRPGHRQDDQG